MPTPKKSASTKRVSASSGSARTASKKSAPGKASAKRRSARKTTPKAKKKIAEVMHEFKEGELVSGGSGKPVKNPKQAIAIALSEAREEGADIPKPGEKADK